MVDAGPADDALAREGEGEKLVGEEAEKKAEMSPIRQRERGNREGQGRRRREQSCSVLPPMKLLMGEEEEEGAEKSSGQKDGGRGQGENVLRPILLLVDCLHFTHFCTRVGKSFVPRFGEFCSCCYLPLLPQLA